MQYAEKTQIMDAAALNRVIIRIAHEIVERNKGASDVALVGIQRRGAPLAMRIAREIEQIVGGQVQVGSLDIALHRDDRPPGGAQPVLSGSDMPFCVTGRSIVLVDDVLYTGRTARAAIDTVIDLGRPGRIQLAVIIDRGHRELPIRADYVGKNVPTSRDETVGVEVMPLDLRDRVALYMRALNNKEA